MVVNKSQKNLNMNIIALFTLLLTNFYSFELCWTLNDTSINMFCRFLKTKKCYWWMSHPEVKEWAELLTLQQLQKQLGTAIVSLLVILFPSNSFGRWTHERISRIRQFFQSNYAGSFQQLPSLPLRAPVKNPIYEWVSNQEENGKMNRPLSRDFQKILIGRDGTIEANFAPQLNPLHPVDHECDWGRLID